MSDLLIQQDIPLRTKTTLRIGGTARYYAELRSKEDLESAVSFALKHHLPLIPLGAGSNTIFADGEINAVIVKIIANAVNIHGNTVIVEAGAYLATLINDLAESNLDLSPLTGIPGTVGGAIFGNAGQGFGGVWIGNFVENVDALVTLEKGEAEKWEVGSGKLEMESWKWKIFNREECQFAYRNSTFKQLPTTNYPLQTHPLIWSATLTVPTRPKDEIQAEIDRLLKRRLETQPHVKTAGSCFLSFSENQPAWKLIDAAGLRGYRVGDIEVSSKHANFLINTRNATYEDAVQIVKDIQSKVKDNLLVEMRFVKKNGALQF